MGRTSSRSRRASATSRRRSRTPRSQARLVTWLRVRATGRRSRPGSCGRGSTPSTRDPADARRRTRCCPTAPASPTRSRGSRARRCCPGSVRLTVATTPRRPSPWQRDRRPAASPAPRCRCRTRACAPGQHRARRARRPKVFAARRGGRRDPLRRRRRTARRPPARRDAAGDYDVGAGARGQRRAGTRSRAGPTLPAGLTVDQPGPDLGRRRRRDGRRGREAGDRATSSTATGWSRPRTSRRSPWRTPGVDVGRVDVLPAFDPRLAPNDAGRRAGRRDADGRSRASTAAHPDAPGARPAASSTRSAATSTRAGS